MKCLIFDLDGTVANCDHRLGLLSKPGFSWDEFHNRAQLDTPYDHMRSLICGLVRKFGIVYSTGRPESSRADTRNWLIHHGVPYVVYGNREALYMRQKGQLFSNAEVKRQNLKRILSDGWEPIMAFEDQENCVKMYRENGVPCAHVQGDYHPYD